MLGEDAQSRSENGDCGTAAALVGRTRAWQCARWAAGLCGAGGDLARQRRIDMAGHRAWPYLPLTLGDVIGQVLILAAAFYIFHSISRHAFDDKLGRLFVLVFVVLAASLLASIYLTTFLCNVHIAIVAGALIVFFAAYKVLDARVD